MKQTILKLIGRATNKKTHVYDIKGKQLTLADMVDDTFYCWNLNSIGSEKNIDTWTKYIASNTDIVKPPVADKTAPKKLNKTEQKNLLETYCLAEFKIDINKSKKLEELMDEVKGYLVDVGMTDDEAVAKIAEVIS